jgi:hypothetical protein
MVPSIVAGKELPTTRALAEPFGYNPWNREDAGLTITSAPTGLELRGKLTALEYWEYCLITSSRWNRLRIYLEALYPVAVLVLMSGYAAEWMHRRWILKNEIIPIGLYLFFIWALATRVNNYWRRLRKSLREFNRKAPYAIRVDATGIYAEYPQGVHRFAPWNEFSGWRLGRWVMSAVCPDGEHAAALPVSDLEGPQRGIVRERLTAALGPAGAKARRSLGPE